MIAPMATPSAAPTIIPGAPPSCFPSVAPARAPPPAATAVLPLFMANVPPAIPRPSFGLNIAAIDAAFSPP